MSKTTLVRRVRETLDPDVPALVHPEWAAELPWAVQGTTTRGTAPPPFDLGLFSGGSAGDEVRENWARLLEATGMHAALHARQVHGAEVLRHDGAVTGLQLVGDCDGHTTAEPGLLLAVTTADCVPIFVVDPVGRRVAILHAGWRGVAAGMLERGLAAITGTSSPRQLHVHLGPAWDPLESTCRHASLSIL